MNQSLYAAGSEAYFNVLHGLSDNYVRVLLVGHNPGIEELLEILTSQIHIMPTCSLACLTLEISKWSDIDYEITKGQRRTYGTTGSQLISSVCIFRCKNSKCYCMS